MSELQNKKANKKHGFFGKIASPFRFLARGIKKVLYKIPITRKLIKAAISVKRNGLRYTWDLFRFKLASRRGNKISGYTKAMLEAQRKTVFEKPVRFSIMVPLYNTSIKFLEELIESVLAQTYENWELCFADGSTAEHGDVESTVQKYAKNDKRIRYMRLKENKGISQNTNECAKMATGDYLVFLDHDDLLAPAALFMNMQAIAEQEPDMLYSDEDHLSEKGKHLFVLHKPDWSPDLLYSQMYTCHLMVVKKSLFEQLGGLDPAFDGSQDYDFVLRLSEVTDKICHIPAILYTWREAPGSTAANADAKPYAHEAGRKALDAHLKRRFGNGAAAHDSQNTFVFDARFPMPAEEPLVSVVIPFKDKCELTDACIKSILEKTTYHNYELLLLDNRSELPETKAWMEQAVSLDPRVRVLDCDMEFNWSKINNFGIDHSNADVFVFLNNDTVVISPDWMERLVENAIREDVGVVGALLLYEDDTIQHAGVVVGMNEYADHLFKGMSLNFYGSPYVSPMISRNVLAVTGACLAVSRKTLDRIGRFDEHFIICGSDVELCIRAYEYGFYNRYDANVRLYHLESKSRDTYIPPVDFECSRISYGPYLAAGDPYYNVNLSRNALHPKVDTVPLNTIKARKRVVRS